MNIYERLIFFGFLLSLWFGINRLVKKYLTAEEKEVPPVTPQPEFTTTSSKPYENEDTFSEDIDYLSIERDVRLAALSEEVARTQHHREHTQVSPTSYTKSSSTSQRRGTIAPKVSPTSYTKSSSTEGPTTLLQQLKKELHQPESLQKAFLLSEILRPKHRFEGPSS